MKLWLALWLVCGAIGVAVDITARRREFDRKTRQDTATLTVSAWIGVALGMVVCILLGPLQLVAAIAIQCSKRMRTDIDGPGH